MKAFYSPYFKKRLSKLSLHIQNKFSRGAGYLLKDIRHPSLRAKKYDESEGVWQARVDDDFRFYFIIDHDTYIFLDIKSHPK
mgnify:CR=1 FL=1